MRRRRAVTRNAGSKVASRIGETSLADTGWRCGDAHLAKRSSAKRSFATETAHTPPLAIKKNTPNIWNIQSNALRRRTRSPAAVLDFYSDVGGVADVMRLDVNLAAGSRAPSQSRYMPPSPPGPGSVLNAPHHFVSKNRAPSRSEAVTRSPSSVPLNAEADRGHNDNHDSHDSHDSHDASLATNDDRSQSGGRPKRNVHAHERTVSY